MERTWVLPLIVGLAVATGVYVTVDAYLFVQRSYARVDSLIDLLETQYSYTLLDKPLAYDPARDIDCNGDDGLFLTLLLDENKVLTVFYSKNPTGAYLWFERSDGTIVFVGHTLWGAGGAWIDL